MADPRYKCAKKPEHSVDINLHCPTFPSVVNKPVTVQGQETEQRQVITTGNNNLTVNVANAPPTGFELQTVTFEVTRRFNEFLQTISALKNQGHNPDPSEFNRLLTQLAGFIAPNLLSFKFYTVGLVIDLPTTAAIVASYTFYATVIFNSWSQHYNYNPVVYIDDPSSTFARLKTDGGENASTFVDNGGVQTPVEQITLTDWEIIWTKINGRWYIYDYAEFGRRIFRFLPPAGPQTLFFQYLFPGAVAEPTTSDPDGLLLFQNKIRERFSQYIKSP